MYNNTLENLKDHYTYQEALRKDAERIRKLYKKTKEVTFAKTDNWVCICGETFNGISKELFYEIVNAPERNNKGGE